MKYCKGFPCKMEVDGWNVTLHDLEHTMLSLYWDFTLSKQDKQDLMDEYKEERMRYLDSRFQFTDENRRRLEEVEQLWKKALQCMDTVCKRMAERELEKRNQGGLAAQVLILHLEICNLEDTEVVCYLREERDLWKVLCEEDRDFEHSWGILRDCVLLNQYGQDETDEGYTVQRTTKADSYGGWETDGEENGVGKDFCSMKKAYYLAWEDVMKISRFYLTVKLIY